VVERCMAALRRALRVAMVVALGIVAFAGESATDAHAQAARGRGWLGVALEPPGAEGGGVRVSHVVRTSPAEKAGIREGDRLVRVAGSVVSSPREVISLLSGHPQGDAVGITLVRGGKEVSVSVTLATFPSSDEMLRLDRVGAFAPTWAGIEPTSGAPPSLASLRGRVVLLDFWATWCAPCRDLAPVLSGLQARYGAQGLSVVGITTDPADAAAQFREHVDMRYPIEIDAHIETSRAYGVSALPTLFIIDKRGVVRDLDIGFDSGQSARVEALVRTLLAEPAPRD
jgi:thiol-disulfide isomerase/thioredoxin